MIPINDLQSKIYQTLNSLDIDVYDEVVEEASLPLINIGDYTISSYEYKDKGFSFNWNIGIYTEYEGKKQVNELTSKVIKCMYELIEANLNNFYFIDDITLNEAQITRNEGYYVANLSVKIDIMQEV